MTVIGWIQILLYCAIILAIVPALVKQYLAEMDLANSDSDAAHSQRDTAAPKLRTMRP